MDNSNNSMKESQKETIESYNQTAQLYREKTDALHPLDCAKKFLSVLEKNNHILDLGCGPGRDAEMFANQGYQVIGVDLSSKMIELAKQRTKNVRFEVMDICNLSFDDNSFDAVWASASFLHIPKDKIADALKEAYRVLKEAGIFYLSLKEGTLEAILPDERYGCVRKLWTYYQEDEIRTHLESTGFKEIEILFEESTLPNAGYRWMKIFCKK